MVNLNVFFEGNAFESRKKESVKEAVESCSLLKPNTPVEILAYEKVVFKGTAYQASKLSVTA